MKIVWSRRAIRHLVHLREYIAKDSAQNAALVANRILKAVELLQAQPGIGLLWVYCGNLSVKLRLASRLQRAPSEPLHSLAKREKTTKEVI